MAEKVALIFGVTGQDGAYLAEYLLTKGYTVHGVKRRASLLRTDRIDHLYTDPFEAESRFLLHHGDMTDASSILRVIAETKNSPRSTFTATGEVPRNIWTSP